MAYKMKKSMGSMSMPANSIMKGKGKCKYAPMRLVMNKMKK